MTNLLILIPVALFLGGLGLAVLSLALERRRALVAA